VLETRGEQLAFIIKISEATRSLIYQNPNPLYLSLFTPLFNVEFVQDVPREATFGKSYLLGHPDLRDLLVAVEVVAGEQSIDCVVFWRTEFRHACR